MTVPSSRRDGFGGQRTARACPSVLRVGCDVGCVVAATESVERQRPSPYDRDGEGEAPRLPGRSTPSVSDVVDWQSPWGALMGRTMAVVLFTDLVGSTELRGRLGEDAADELRRRHDQLLAQAVEANNGRVVKGLGDGIMATFAGASDAVAAAVAIQQAVDRLNRSGKASVPLAVRVGLSAGDVSFEDDDVHGTPVIEAARLCAAAGGGEILAAEVVRALAGSTGGHDYVSGRPSGVEGPRSSGDGAPGGLGAAAAVRRSRCRRCSPTSGGSSSAATPNWSG